MKTKTERSEHTPGPWKAKQDFLHHADYYVMFDDNSKGGVHTRRLDDKGVFMEANARLIAAAPDLLEALKEAQKLIGIAREYFPKSITQADRFSLENTCATVGSAIAKAEGRI